LKSKDYPIEEEVERYYKYLNEEESQLFLSRLINFNKDKLTDPFYSRFFAAIKRGSDNGDIFLTKEQQKSPTSISG